MHVLIMQNALAAASHAGVDEDMHLIFVSSRIPCIAETPQRWLRQSGGLGEMFFRAPNLFFLLRVLAPWCLGVKNITTSCSVAIVVLSPADG